LTADLPVRIAHKETILDLFPLIPDTIPGSNERTSPENLRWMLHRCLDELLTFPVDKLGRWVGFVQGVLALSSNLDVDAERDRTRGRFHAAYEATGQVIPKTMQLGD
jgi:hypothetical protein